MKNTARQKKNNIDNFEFLNQNPNSEISKICEDQHKSQQYVFVNIAPRNVKCSTYLCNVPLKSGPCILFSKFKLGKGFVPPGFLRSINLFLHSLRQENKSKKF